MTNIVLIGMSGSGKSTLGVLLAKAMNKAFVDTDLLIQRKHNAKLEELIAIEGISQFKVYEEAVIIQLEMEQTVISTGGSVIYSDKSMEHLSKDGTLIFLDVDYKILEARILNIQSRGIVIEDGQTLFDLYQERKPLYQKYADYVIKIENETIEQSVSRLINILHEMV